MLCRWVFLGEGIPSICLALVLPWLLPTGPARMKPGKLLNQQELLLLSADVSAISLIVTCRSPSAALDIVLMTPDWTSA